MKKRPCTIIVFMLICIILTSCNRTIDVGGSAYISTEIPYDAEADADQNNSTASKPSDKKTTKSKKNNKKKKTTSKPIADNATNAQATTTSPKSDRTTPTSLSNKTTSFKKSTQSANSTTPQSPTESDSALVPDNTPEAEETTAIYGENGLEYVFSEGYLWLSSRGKCTQKNITVPHYVNGKTVIGIASGAFSGDSTIESVTISEGITSICNAAFLGCNKLKTVNLPSTLKKIEQGAFNKAPITSMKLPDGLTYIGKAAFAGIQMKQLDIPNSVQTIEESAFRESALEKITIPRGATLGQSVFKNCSALTTVTLPEGMTTIPSQAFYKCTSLTTLNLPDSITTIGSHAFYSCNKLIIKQLTLRNCGGFDAFNSLKIENADIYANQHNRSFMHASIQKLTIHEGVTTIGEDVFTYASIKNISLPTTLSTVDGSAFYGSNIDEVVFTGAVTLGHSAFKNSTIKSVTLPVGSKLEHYVFSGCEQLEAIRYGGTTQQWSTLLSTYGYVSEDYAELNRVTIICSNGTINPK